MDIKHNISENQREKGCPFGQRCDACNLYRPLYLHQAPGQEPVQEYDCAFAHTMILVGELKANLVGVQEAVETRGNETIKRQDQFLDVITNAKRIAHGH